MRFRPIAFIEHYRFRLAVASVMVILLIGTYGFFAENQAVGGLLARLLDAAYRTIQTFGLNFDMPQGADGSTTNVNPWIQTARFGAAVFTFFAVVSLLTQRLLERFILFLHVRCRRRHVLLGFGAVNRAIAEALVVRPDARGWLFSNYVAITAVDRTVSPADRRAAAETGVLLIEGDVDDPELRRRLRLDRAEKIFVCLGEDGPNLETAARLCCTNGLRGFIL